MGQALYRKYRSKSLSEIIGQEHITETLDKALKGGRISHAYLFTGPRGVGKTSIARILAHEINGLPYDDDSMHLDIIEIDAASNRRIDEIRELRDKVAIAPSSCKYKVYIIDEVHMLTKEAFNALLKTLEEPPAHVVFILATTDAHKLPETIVSRTQRFTFKPVAAEKVIAHLKTIAKQEKIDVSDDALALLAAHGEGSFRDSISLLDQASSHGQKLELSGVQSLLGIPPQEGIDALVAAMVSSSGPAIIGALSELYDQGFQAAAIAKLISHQLRAQLVSDTSQLPPDVTLNLLTRLLEVPIAHDPERFLEIVVLSVATLSTPPVASSPSVASTHSAPPLKHPEATPPKAAEPPKHAPQPKEIKKPIVEPPVVKAKSTVVEPPAKPEVKESAEPKTEGAFTIAMWPQVLDALKKKYNTLYGVVRMATPSVDGDELEIAFGFAFHQKRVTDPKNRKILADIIQDICGQVIHISCVVRKGDPKLSPAATPKIAASPLPDLGAINDIFGGGEVV